MFATASEPFRGVSCFYCAKPVRIPELVARRETTALLEEQQYLLASKAFALRCHACQKESVYTTDQIVTCVID